MKKFFFTLAVLLSGTGLHAFSVSGKVTDSGTGQGLQNVSVVIEEIKAVNVTSSDGSFVFENIPAGFYTIHTAHPLYEGKVRKSAPS